MFWIRWCYLKWKTLTKCLVTAPFVVVTVIVLSTVPESAHYIPKIEIWTPKTLILDYVRTADKKNANASSWKCLNTLAMVIVGVIANAIAQTQMTIMPLVSVIASASKDFVDATK